MLDYSSELGTLLSFVALTLVFVLAIFCRRCAAMWLALLIASAATFAIAQKPGGTLRFPLVSSPPSASLLEEVSIFVVQPFMPVFKNLVVYECAVGVPDVYRGESAKAFVVLRPDAEPLTLEALRAFLSDRVGRHEMPAALEIRDTLPRTPAGKLSRKELADEERNRAAST